MKKLLFTFLIILSTFIAQGQVTITTTSSDAGWSPSTVTKSGAVLSWTAASNGVFLGQTVNANDPTFDFSTNDGTPIDITVSSSDGFSGLTRLDFWNDNGLGSQLTNVDVTNATALTNLNTRYNLLTSLDVTSNIALTSLTVRGNSQLSSGTLDISNNTQLTFIQADVTQLSSISLANNTLLTDVRLYSANLTSPVLDQILIDLDAHGLSSGNLQIASNAGSLTSAALTAYNNLIGKSWTIDVPAPPAPSVDVITLTTTSTSATWSPATVTNTGAVLTWEASGGGITTQTINANDPTFDLSANTGTVTITITSTEGFASVTNFDFYTPNAEITSIVDLDEAGALLSLNTRYNLLNSLDVTSNTLLTSLNVRGNSQLSSGTLDISNNTQLTFIQADVTQLSSISLANNTLLTDVRLYSANLTSLVLDQIVIDLDNHGLLSGNLQISGNTGSLTSAALTAYNNLIGKGWTIDVPAPPAASVDVITLTTTSTSATWSPATVTNTGATLTWEASGGGITTQTINADDPTFDLSANTGTVTITITSTEGFAAVTNFDFYTPNAEITSIVGLDEAGALLSLSTRYNLLNSLDVTSNTLLTSLNVRGNSQLSSGAINISNNTQLTFIQADATQLSSISLANNTLLTDVRLHNANLTSGALDQIVIDLDTHGLSNGNLQISGNTGSLTSAALIAYNSLIAKNWTIDVPAPPAAPGAEINVVGNSVSIVSGNTPILADHTDFGDVVIGVPQTHTFTIENQGASNLTINFFFTSGTDYTFAPPGGGSMVLGTGATTTIDVTFDPQAVGVKTGLISINSDDPDEGTYIINLSANGVNTPTNEIIDVIGNGISITNGDITPDSADDTDFGIVQNILSKTNTYTIENDGTDPLTITSIEKALGGDPQFTIDNISQATPTILAPGGSMTFEIIFIPGATGNYSAIIEIVNSDVDQTPFQFKIAGEGSDVVVSGEIMITQYYEGTTNSKWIEIKNISGAIIPINTYFLALYSDIDIPNITTQSPSTSIPIPSMAIDEVLLFKNIASPSRPFPASIGSATQIQTSVCDFDGNDIILISRTDNATCYSNRQDIVGTLATSPAWGFDRSFIRGGSNESPESNFDMNNWILLSPSADVDSANPNTNIALGSQNLGTTTWTGASWNNLTPDRTRTTEIAAAYSSSNGTFSANDLTINSSLNFDNNTTNSVVVYGDLTISSPFTIGDTESLVMYKGNATITGNITKLEESTSRNNQHDFTYWSSPVRTASIGAVFSGVTSSRIFLYDQLQTSASTLPEAYDNWLLASGSMVRARGYAAEGPTGTTGVHTISFTGSPNNGPISIELNRHSDGDLDNDFNLVGNPYPSAIDGSNFLNNNGNIRKALYLWTHQTAISGGISGDFISSDYAVYNLSGGAGVGGGAAPTNNIGSSQGFFVAATSGGFVNFNNAMRLVDVNDQFFKSNNSKSKAVDDKEEDRVWLSITTDQGGANQLLIAFMEKATDGVDNGYDALRFKNSSNPIAFYSMIEDDKYTIQGLGTFSADKTINLGFDTTVAPRTFTIGIKEIEGVLKDAEVYLVDHVLNVVHDLKDSDYQFEHTTTGENLNRFTLQFAGAALSVDDIVGKEDFIISNQYDGLKIKSSKTVQSMRVYDLLGRMLIQQSPKAKSFDIRTGSIKAGTILLLEATLENGSVISRKTIKY